MAGWDDAPEAGTIEFGSTLNTDWDSAREAGSERPEAFFSARDEYKKERVVSSKKEGYSQTQTVPMSRDERLTAKGHADSPGAGSDAQFVAALGGNSQDLQKAVGEYKNMDPADFDKIQVGKDRFGDVWFNTPDMGDRHEPIDAAGFDNDDWAAVIPDATVLGVETAAMLATLYATRNPLAVDAAGGLAAGLTEYVMLEWAREAGYLSSPDSARRGMETGLASFIGGRVLGGARTAKQAITGDHAIARMLEKDVGTNSPDSALKRMVEQGQDAAPRRAGPTKENAAFIFDDVPAVAERNARTGVPPNIPGNVAAHAAGREVPQTSAQTVGNVKENQTVAQQLRANEMAATDPVAVAERARIQQAQTNADTATAERMRGDGGDIDQFGADVKAGGKAEVEQQIDANTVKGGNEVGRQELKFDENVDATAGDMGAELRGHLFEARKNLFETLTANVRVFWKKIDPKTPYDLTKYGEIANRWAKNNARDFHGVSEAQAKVVGDAKYVAKADSEAKRLAALEAEGKDVFGDDFAYPQGDEEAIDMLLAEIGGARDLHDVSLAMSKFKFMKREFFTPDDAAGRPNQFTINELFNELEYVRNEALKDIHPDLLKELLKHEAKLADAHNALDGNFVQTVLAKRNAIDFVHSSDVLLEEAMEHMDDFQRFLDASKQYPEIGGPVFLRQSIADRYVRTMGKSPEFVEGVATVTKTQKHDAFMEEHRKIMEKLYSKGEMKTFNNAHTAQIAMETARDVQATTLTNIRKSTAGQVQSMSPRDIVKYTMKSKENALEIKRLVSPEQWKQYQGARRTSLWDEVDINNTGSFGRLKGMLRKGEGATGDRRRELEATLGPDYLADLDNFAAEISARDVGKGGFRAVQTSELSGVSLLNYGRNMLYGPLTRMGFRVRQTQGMLMGSINNKMERILANPEKLKEFMQMQAKSIYNRAYWNYLGSLGVNTYALAHEINDPKIPLLKDEQTRKRKEQ